MGGRKKGNKEQSKQRARFEKRRKLPTQEGAWACLSLSASLWRASKSTNQQQTKKKQVEKKHCGQTHNQLAREREEDVGKEHSPRLAADTTPCLEKVQRQRLLFLQAAVACHFFQFAVSRPLRIVILFFPFSSLGLRAASLARPEKESQGRMLWRRGAHHFTHGTSSHASPQWLQWPQPLLFRLVVALGACEDTPAERERVLKQTGSPLDGSWKRYFLKARKSYTRNRIAFIRQYSRRSSASRHRPFALSP